jgi:hypothetical protein
VARLDDGIEIQHRMAFEGEAFVARFGRHAAEATPKPFPPVRPCQPPRQLGRRCSV